MQNEFGAELKGIMDKQRCSMGQLARKSGAAQPFVSEVIAGKKRPSYDMAQRWLDVLNVQTDDRTKLLRLLGIAYLPEQLREDFLHLLSEYL